MGKIEGIFATNISGKVGNVVFRKAGKQNIVSQRPASVKNPRTDMQQRQRAYIKTVSSAYSVLKPICDHSFEGVAYGADSMNFFKKENYKIVSSAGKAVLKNSSNVVVNSEFLISKGSIKWNMALDETGQIANISQFMSQNKITSIADITYDKLCVALGIKKGDQLTIINVLKHGKMYESALTDQWACNMYFSRYVLDAVAEGSSKAFVKSGGSSGDYILNASILAKESEFDFNAVLVATEAGVLKIINNIDELPYMYTAIISRRSVDKWLRSTANLYTGVDLGEEYYIKYVLPSYNPSGERYLNNAKR